MKRIMAIAALCTLAGCGSSSMGWDPDMECTQRDNKHGWCTAATYSCSSDSKVLAYYPSGPRCFERNVR